MGRWLLIFGAALALGGLGPAADEKPDDAKRMQGAWAMASSNHEGRSMPEGLVKEFRREVRGNEYAVFRGDKEVVKGTFTLDPSRKPKAIDVKLTSGPDKDRTMLGIYEFDGEVLRLCFAPPGKERPKDFAAKTGTPFVLSTWKRAKK